MKFLQEGMEQAIVTNDFKSYNRTFEGIRYSFSWEDVNTDACVSYTKGSVINEVCAAE
ncbi:hypothetical protein [Bacillus sp. Marseille-Q1617]|uniref:hypothetical protein n=1 Tax=Bacillus sp. Marseille-Q1617 TaxID=2736887 RepID=UPI0015894EE0|nr:hypothetical protein [Bacillus sp. Marseille-Q1617]